MARKPAPKKRRTPPKARKPAKRRKPSDKLGHRRAGFGAQPVSETRARMGLSALVAHNCRLEGRMEIEAGKPCNWCGVTEFGEQVISAEALPKSPFCRFCMQPTGSHLEGCRMITKRDRVIPLGVQVIDPPCGAGADFEVPTAPRFVGRCEHCGADETRVHRATCPRFPRHARVSWWRRLIDWASAL